MRIARQADEPIDGLFYGYLAPPRMDLIRHIAQHGIKIVYTCGLYGPTRDDLISRSKIALNLNKNTEGRIFEIIRVSYLLANARAVVSDIYFDSKIDDDLQHAIAWAQREQVSNTCLQLLADDPARKALAQRGFEIFKKRDIREILARALAAP